jgi:hypothetical protein
MDAKWAFDSPRDLAVVTTKYVTLDRLPVLYVTHELDEDGEVLWQFHCGNGDLDPGVLQLVRLDEIVGLDETLTRVADLPLGFSATRRDAGDEWQYASIA